MDHNQYGSLSLGEEGEDEVGRDESEGEENAEGEKDNEAEGREVEEEVDDIEVVGRLDEGNGSEAENNEEEATVGGEIPKEVVVAEREEEVVDRDDGDNVEAEKDVHMEVDEPESEGLKEVVILEEEPEAEETPADERMLRRNTRRSKKLDEIMAAKRARKLQFGTSEGEEEIGEDIPEAKETPEQTNEVSAEAMEKRYAAGRKRKWKQEAKPLKKKHRQASSTLLIQEPSPDPIWVHLPSRHKSPRRAMRRKKKRRPTKGRSPSTR